jgi:hypothetical protein
LLTNASRDLLLPSTLRKYQGIIAIALISQNADVAFLLFARCIVRGEQEEEKAPYELLLKTAPKRTGPDIAEAVHQSISQTRDENCRDH